MRRFASLLGPECSTGKSRIGSASPAGGSAKLSLSKGTEHRQPNLGSWICIL